jgi:uncharacterized protein (UPF0333 family)
MLFRKKGQISMEFSILFLVIMVMSMATIYHFLSNNFNSKDVTLNKIDVGAKTAVSLINSGYNGTYNEYPITYLGMKYDSTMTNITIIVYTPKLSDSARDFILKYIYNNQNIDPNEYNIAVYWENTT